MNTTHSHSLPAADMPTLERTRIAYLILSAVVQFPVFGLRQARNSNLMALLVHYTAHIPFIGIPLYRSASSSYFCRGCFDRHACLFLAWVRLWLSSPGNFELRIFKELACLRFHLIFTNALCFGIISKVRERICTKFTLTTFTFSLFFCLLFFICLFVIRVYQMSPSF